MIWVVENQAGERATISNLTGWKRLLDMEIDCLANRFRRDSEIILTLPVNYRAVGQGAALRAVASQMGTIYPADHRLLAVVDAAGTVLVGPGDKVELARRTGTSRATIWDRYAGQRLLDGVGWVVSGCDGVASCSGRCRK